MDGALLMPHILAFTSTPEPTDAVDAVGAVMTALARTLHLTAEQRRLPTGTHGTCAAVLLAVDEPTVRLAMLPHSPGNASLLVTEVIRQCPKPVVLVPRDLRAAAPELIERILVPLDGTTESAETVAETVALYAASGADIVVLHVFDETTVPKFWDQAVHARKSWDEEFLPRSLLQPSRRAPGAAHRQPGREHRGRCCDGAGRPDRPQLGAEPLSRAGPHGPDRGRTIQHSDPAAPLPSSDARDRWRCPAGVETAAGS